MKKLTPNNRILLKDALNKINNGINYYNSQDGYNLYPEGMCSFMNNLDLSMEKDKIFTAFLTTKPKGKEFSLYWYPRFELQPRINHLTKIRKEIKTVLKNGYY